MGKFRFCLKLHSVGRICKAKSHFISKIAQEGYS